MNAERKLLDAVEYEDLARILRLSRRRKAPDDVLWQATAFAIEQEKFALADLLLPHLAPTWDSQAACHAASGGHLALLQNILPLVQTPLLNVLVAACEHGHIDCVRLLLTMTDPAECESLALRSAALNGHTKIVKLLLPLSNPKAEHCQALANAAIKGHLPVVKLLLPHSSKILAATEVFPLAAKAGRMELVRHLVKAKLPDPVETYLAGLEVAVRGGHVALALYLIEEINEVAKPYELTMDAFDDACRQGLQEVVMALVPWLNQAQCAYGVVRLLEKGHQDVAEALLPFADLAKIQCVRPQHQSMLDQMLAKLEAQQIQAELQSGTPPSGVRTHAARL